MNDLQNNMHAILVAVNNITKKKVLPVHAIHAHGEAEVLVHSFLNSALHRSGQLHARSFYHHHPRHRWHSHCGSNIFRGCFTKGCWGRHLGLKDTR